MNNKGLAFLYNLMLGILIIILAIALAYPTKAPIDESRSDLNCEAPASDFDEGTCLLLDIIKFALPGALLFIGLYVLTRK